jgi:hypothetical protein
MLNPDGSIQNFIQNGYCLLLPVWYIRVYLALRLLFHVSSRSSGSIVDFHCRYVMFVQEVTHWRKIQIYRLFEVYGLSRVLRREPDVSEENIAYIFKGPKSTTKQGNQNNQTAKFSSVWDYSKLYGITKTCKLLTYGAEPCFSSCQLCSYSRHNKKKT